MNKKMFFIDLDGTTLRDDKSVPEENLKAIHEAVDQGHYVAIATGRGIGSARSIAGKLKMMRKGCFLICYNGGMIYDLEDDTLLRDLRLPDEYAAYLFSEAEKYHLHIQAYREQYVIARKECQELLFYAGNTNMEYRIEENLCEKNVYDTPKVLLVSLAGKSCLEKFQRDHREWEEGRCISFFSSPEYLEYCPLHGTKADGIAFFEDYLGIGHENTVAIGDEENDLSMIRRAGVGVVMCNARDDVKVQADYITKKDNNHGGVAEVIKKYTETVKIK